MLERIKAAVDAVTRERLNKKLLRQHVHGWEPLDYTWTVAASDWITADCVMPVWDGSVDGTLATNTWSSVFEPADPGIIWDRLDNGVPYDTSSRYTYTNGNMLVW